MKKLQKIKISAKKLRLIRIAKGLKQEELGRLLDITGSAISIYERNNQDVKIETANKICNALECNIADIAEESTINNKIQAETIDKTKNLEKVFQSILNLSEESREVIKEIALRLEKLEAIKGKTQNVGNIQNSKDVKIIQN